jgi:hypothetical protein
MDMPPNGGDNLLKKAKTMFAKASFNSASTKVKKVPAFFNQRSSPCCVPGTARI